MQEVQTSKLAHSRPAGLEDSPETVAVDWSELIDHRAFVQADETMEQAHHKFLEEDVAYMAVVEGERAMGLCARHQVGMILGSQYGFPLFARTPIRDYLIPEPLIIQAGQPWSGVLQRVFSRTGASFNEDVLLVDGDGRFLGLISLQTLVRLQTRLLTHSIAQLEDKQAEISRRNRRMTEDLLIARELQMAMLPRELPAVPSGIGAGRGTVRISSHYLPLGLVSGDFFEVLAVSEAAVGVMIADVMGHGVQAALITAMMRALIHEHASLAVDPGALLEALNDSLYVILEGCRLTTFVSAFALVADLEQACLRFANAGHPLPILLRRGRAFPLDPAMRGNGGVLGVDRNARFPVERCEMLAGDRVLLFTDGLFEVQGADGEILGEGGLLQLAEQGSAGEGDDWVRELAEAARKFSPELGFADDVCLVGLEFRETLGRDVHTCATKGG